jgi:hypothetical protein
MPANFTTLAHFSVSSFDELPELSDWASERLATNIGKPRLHGGIGESGVDFLAEPVDDLGGVLFGAPTRYHWLAS